MLKNFSATPYTNLIVRATLLLIILTAFFWRTYQLDTQSLRGDEAATVHYAAMPISELWELSRVTDPHPPGYYLMLHPWKWLLGKDAWLMRYTGVIASVLGIASLYTLARITLRQKSMAVLAAALLAINPFQIWLAQDLRSYPVFMLLGLLSSWALWIALNKKRLSLTPWILYIFFTVACLYVHYYTVFLIAFQGLFVIFNAKKYWHKKWPWLISQLSIGLLIIPGLYLASHLAGQAAGGIDTISNTEIFRRAATALLTGFTIDTAPGVWVSVLLTPVWIIGLIALLRRNVTVGIFWGLFFAVPVVSVIALSIDRPFFKERFLIQALPAFEVLLAAGFVTLWKFTTPQHGTRRSVTYVIRFVTLLLLSMLIATNLHSLNNYFSDPAYAKAPPWHLYLNYVNDNARPNDVMLTNFPEASVSYYTPNNMTFRVIPNERDLPVERLLHDTADVADQYTRIWFLPLLRQGFDEEGDVLNWLDRHGDRVNQIFFPAYHVNLYLTPQTIDAQLIAQSVSFAHNIQLRGYQVFDQRGDSRVNDQTLTLNPGDEFTLSLYWQADSPTDVPYTVFTHLIAADGFNQASQDNQPVWGTYPTTQWQPNERVTDKFTLTLPPGLPPGNYRIHVGWYQSDTSARVPVLDSTGQIVNDNITLNLIVRVKEN